VQELLRDSLKFKGLIVTDAMNMGGVRNVPNNNTKAIAAGCDILLMPADARKAHLELMTAYDIEDMKKTIDASAPHHQNEDLLGFTLGINLQVPQER
jgi:beta-N-acetylhexosaminidase